jgi:hypothetical protein
MCTFGAKAFHFRCVAIIFAFAFATNFNRVNACFFFQLRVDYYCAQRWPALCSPGYTRGACRRKLVTFPLKQFTAALA